MEITEVRVSVRDGRDKKLKGYATVTFDNCFVVRDLRIIDGQRGLFVAMPSRRIREPCPKCTHRNPVRSNFCSHCGASLEGMAAAHREEPGEGKGQHRDVAHPITQQCREFIQKAVIDAYEKERARDASRCIPGTETIASPLASKRSR